MRIAIGSDHVGFNLKNDIIDFLKSQGHEVKDFGCYSLDSCDYPDFGFPVAISVKNKEYDRGIVICSTGIGMSIVANKVAGIRCALVTNCECARLTREHNDSNVLALGAKVVSKELAKEIVDIWLNTEFTGGRHLNRVNKIKEYEGEQKNE